MRSTGPRTEIGKIGQALQILEPEDTNLQQQTGKIVRNFALIGLGLCVLVVIVFGLTRGDWLQGFLAGLTLAMATLPEEFPVVLTIFLALGAWRISQHKVLTRRMPAVEMLGAATALCVDKTGTLTLNRMTVTKLVVQGEAICSGRQTTSPARTPARSGRVQHPGQPGRPVRPDGKGHEGTGRTHAGKYRPPAQGLDAHARISLSEKLLAMSDVWRSPDAQEFVGCSQGSARSDRRPLSFR